MSEKPPQRVSTEEQFEHVMTTAMNHAQNHLLQSKPQYADKYGMLFTEEHAAMVFPEAVEGRTLDSDLVELLNSLRPRVAVVSYTPMPMRYQQVWIRITGVERAADGVNVNWTTLIGTYGFRRCKKVEVRDEPEPVEWLARSLGELLASYEGMALDSELREDTI